ncbi:MAG: ABC transporter ATP-binding protein [Acidimicrobiales bacterium]
MAEAPADLDMDRTASRSSEALLTVRGLRKTFGGVEAVAGVDMSIRAGETVGLVGPNGAGKTTLFNCICGQVRPGSGTIVFDGVPLDRMPVYRRARLGIGRTYQRIELFPELSVRDHLLVAERARSGHGRLWKDLLNRARPQPDELSRVEAALQLVGLSDLADTSVAALGLGTCRVVELARALVAEPRLLLADEPSSGLDVHETRQLADILRTVQRRRGMAVLLVEHDLAMVERVADRAIAMDLGQVIAEGPLKTVMAEGRVRHAYLGTDR